MSAKDHSRVTAEGRALGSIGTRLADLGRVRLEAAGLTDLKFPRLRDEMCRTCACQAGSVPNGCLQTQMDFLKCVVEGTPFLCHAPHDGKLCAGWARARAQVVATPLPPEVVALVATWKLSPPDEPEA